MQSPSPAHARYSRHHVRHDGPSDQEDGSGETAGPNQERSAPSIAQPADQRGDGGGHQKREGERSRDDPARDAQIAFERKHEHAKGVVENAPVHQLADADGEDRAGGHRCPDTIPLAAARRRRRAPPRAVATSRHSRVGCPPRRPVHSRNSCWPRFHSDRSSTRRSRAARARPGARPPSRRQSRSRPIALAHTRCASGMSAPVRNSSCRRRRGWHRAA